MLSSDDKMLIKENINSDKLFDELVGKPFVIGKKDPQKPFETYSYVPKSEICDVERCGEAYACIIGNELMGADKPQFKSRVKPTAWKSIGCDYIEDGKCLYNRCHLIGRQLATQKVDKKGLITGTRKFNVEGMFKFEDETVNYIKNNPNHRILYRVTPYFEHNNLLAYGVQMEILDIDDEEKFSYNVFVYNKQPGFILDYRNGDVYSDYSLTLSGKRSGSNIYVIDMDTNIFHKETCAGVCDIENKRYFVGGKHTLGKEYCKCEICIS